MRKTGLPNGRQLVCPLFDGGRFAGTLSLLKTALSFFKEVGPIMKLSFDIEYRHAFYSCVNEWEVLSLKKKGIDNRQTYIISAPYCYLKWDQNLGSELDF